MMRSLLLRVCRLNLSNGICTANTDVFSCLSLYTLLIFISCVFAVATQVHFRATANKHPLGLGLTKVKGK